MAGKKLQGQVAIVTGASRGVGATSAIALAKAGAALVLTSRDGSQIEAVAKEIRQGGGKAIAVPADVSVPEQVEEVVESAIDQLRRVDILVNNAAIAWPIDEVADGDPEEWCYNINVNLLGPFLLAQNVLPLMIEQGYGRIVNVSSGAARMPIAGLSAYCTAKAGLDMFTQVLAKEVAGKGVTANCLYPGMVDTDMQSDIRSVDTSESDLDFSHWHQAYESQSLLPVQAVARMITWLVGPWSRSRSGEIFNAADDQWLATVATDLG